MMSESKLVLEMWETFRDHVQDKNKPDVLFKMFSTLEDYGIFAEDLAKDLKGEDRHIDAALMDFVEEVEDFDDLEEYED